ncbi:hypothetical protein AXX16_0343 [Serratia rubidaea]|nr:hypothetical protein AXX16_0343 [Serratia rubidaea]
MANSYIFLLVISAAIGRRKKCHLRHFFSVYLNQACDVICPAIEKHVAVR